MTKTVLVVVLALSTLLGPPASGEIAVITTDNAEVDFGGMVQAGADLPVIIHDPIFTEANVGSYAATDLPDQATVLAAAGVPTGNTVARQTVFEARLALQAQF